jgi:hypothetical protein
MTTERVASTATLLANGAVLLAGGFNNHTDPEELLSAELYE